MRTDERERVERDTQRRIADAVRPYMVAAFLGWGAFLLLLMAYGFLP